jgi:hypothetical protein
VIASTASLKEKEEDPTKTSDSRDESSKATTKTAGTDEDASDSDVVPAVFVVALLLSSRESEVLVGSSSYLRNA